MFWTVFALISYAVQVVENLKKKPVEPFPPVPHGARFDSEKYGEDVKNNVSTEEILKRRRSGYYFTYEHIPEDNSIIEQLEEARKQILAEQQAKREEFYKSVQEMNKQLKEELKNKNNNNNEL